MAFDKGFIHPSVSELGAHVLFVKNKEGRTETYDSS